MIPPKEAESSQPGDPGDSDVRPPKKLGDLQKTITMAQIAKAAGVSQGAISSLLNDRDYGIRVSEKTRERVFKVCREMGYIPNDLRAVVRMYPEFGDYCLLISKRISAGLKDCYVARIAAAAMSAVPDPSRPLTLAYYDETADYAAEPEHLPAPVREGIASKFICYGGPNATLVNSITRRGLPLLWIGHDVPLPHVLSYVPDYPEASRLAIEHLFKQGHRQIAIVSGPFGTNDPQIIEFNRGVRIAYEQLGIPIEAQNIIYGDLTFRAGVAAFDGLVERKPEPTAIFCMSDAVAVGLLARAHERGRSVPKDLSVVGCGDDMLAQLTNPALTTIHIPAEEIARQAVSELDRLIQVGVPNAARKTVIGVRLIERGTTAAASTR